MGTGDRVPLAASFSFDDDSLGRSFSESSVGANSFDVVREFLEKLAQAFNSPFPSEERTSSYADSLVKAGVPLERLDEIYARLLQSDRGRRAGFEPRPDEVASAWRDIERGEAAAWGAPDYRDELMGQTADAYLEQKTNWESGGKASQGIESAKARIDAQVEQTLGFLEEVRAQEEGAPLTRLQEPILVGAMLPWSQWGSDKQGEFEKSGQEVPADEFAHIECNSQHPLYAEQYALSLGIKHIHLRPLVCMELEPCHFYYEVNRRIFVTLREMWGNAESVNVSSICQRLRSEGNLGEGGSGYVMRLQMRSPGENEVGDSPELRAKEARRACLVLKNLHAGREFVEYNRQIERELASGKLSVEAALERASRKNMELGAQVRQVGENEGPKTMAQALQASLHKLQLARQSGKSVTGLATGFRDLDQMTTGLKPADLVIIGGRPGSGKTSLATCLAHNVAVEQNKPVLFFSLEMSHDQIADRFYSAYGRINSLNWSKGALTEDEMDGVGYLTEQIANYPLIIEDRPVLKLTDILSASLEHQARMKVKKGPDGQTYDGISLVIVDYLQKVKHGRADERLGVAQVAVELKQLGRLLKCPVVALAQVSRKCEDRENKRPLLSDLAESGQIEAEADIVAFIYRASYYNRDKLPPGAHDPDKGIAECIVGKHRKGKTGTIRLHFEEEYTRFNSFEPESGGEYAY